MNKKIPQKRAKADIGAGTIIIGLTNGSEYTSRPNAVMFGMEDGSVLITGPRRKTKKGTKTSKQKAFW
ncbi:MAG: hypothetical protein U9Q34_03980 [Elusimicrobiota bacterium]|nr:hypothetical protein [Elusimicrobiota bacterium]